MKRSILSFDEAVNRYFRNARNTEICEQPSGDLSELIDSARPTWLLKNCRGLIARVDAVSGRIHRSQKEE